MYFLTFLVKKVYMQKVSFVFQIIFKITLIFFITFIWVRYFTRSLLWSVVISAAITLVIDFVTRFFSRKKQSISALKKADREQAEDCFLSLSQNKNAIEFFLNLAEKKHNATKKKNFIVITHENDEKVVLFPHLSHNPLSPDDVAVMVAQTQTLKPAKIVIVCSTVQKESFCFAKNFDCEILILDQYETYQKLYKEYDCFPPITIKYKKQKGLAFKDLVAYSLNRSRAKGYFISALILILSSLFVRATIYYCVVASLLIIFALISLYNPFARNVKTNQIL